MEMALVKIDIRSGRAERYLSLCVAMEIIDPQYCERYRMISAEENCSREHLQVIKL